MNRYRQQVQAVVEAVGFRLPDRFLWFGRRVSPLRHGAGTAPFPEGRRRFLLSALERQLYAGFYCRGRAEPPLFPGVGPEGPGAAAHVAALTAANAGQGFLQGGWEVEAVGAAAGVTVAGGAAVTVRHAGLTVRVPQERCVAPAGSSLRPGLPVYIRMEKDLPAVSPGYYMALGDRELRRTAGGGLVRIYWNLTPDGAILLMRQLTAALNRGGLPFQLKLLNDPAAYRRCDAGVLYIDRADYGAVAERLEVICPEAAPWLKPAVPAFTRPLAPGVGLAEEPGAGLSFGMDRCRRLAAALLRAAEEGLQSAAERLAFVEDALAQEGIRLDAPYLNPGSADGYRSLAPRPDARRAPCVAGQGAPDLPLPAAQDCLAAALAIGRRLSAEAFWHGNRCNWLGLAAAGSRSAPRYEPLGPDLYAGSGGVALFLAELAAVTGEAQARSAALGAIRQALVQAEVALPGGAGGFYTGAAGVAVAALRIGRLLGEEELHRKGEALRERSAGGGGQEERLLLGVGGPLARLRAYAREGEPFRRPALAGLARSRRAIESALEAGDGDFVLAGGMAGYAEVLRYGLELFGPEGGPADLVLRVAGFGLAAHGSGRRPWSCAGGDEVPGLLNGLAGIGHFYLRLGHPTLPSVLLLHPQTLTPR